MIISGLSLSDYVSVFVVFSPLKEPKSTSRSTRSGTFKFFLLDESSATSLAPGPGLFR